MKLRAYSFAALVLLSACAAGPGQLPKAADVTLPSDFAFATQASDETAVADLLPQEDPAFATLAGVAITQSPSLGEALARVETARASAARAGAERLPSINAGASVERSRQNTSQFGAAGAFIDSERTTYGANVAARWDADLFGELRNRERAALARLDAAGASAAAVRIALVAEIAAAVVDWRTLDAREEALKQDEDAATELARLAGVRERAGIAPGFDRVRAEAIASSSRSRLASLDSERARIVGRLVGLTALPAPAVLDALQVDAPPSDLGQAPAALPSTLLTSRPDITAAAAQLEAADADVAAAAARRFPKLTLSGVLGLLSFNFGGLFDSDAIVGSLAGDIAGPLLDFGRIAAEIDRAEAETVAAFEAFRGTVFTALGETEAAYALIAAADREAEAARTEANEADRAAKLAETRYRAGLADFLTVLEARRSADASQERAAAAAGRAQRARILLWQALGGSPISAAR